MQFLNATDIKRTFESIKVGPNGKVTYIQRFYGDFSMRLDLRKFPFDSELLWIGAGSIDYGSNEVTFVVDKDWTEMLILPLKLIVFMPCAVFWIDSRQVGPRISLSLISMLNIIAYNFAISTFIPRISYLTLADKYIMGCLIIVFLALVEGITSSTLASQDKEALAKRIDRVSRWAFPVGFLLLIGFAFAT